MVDDFLNNLCKNHNTTNFTNLPSEEQQKNPKFRFAMWFNPNEFYFPYLNMEGEEINFVNHVKYLGMIIDN